MKTIDKTLKDLVKNVGQVQRGYSFVARPAKYFIVDITPIDTKPIR